MPSGQTFPPADMTSWLSSFATNQVTGPAPICKNGPCQICIQVAQVDEEINQAISSLQRLVARRCDLRSEQNHVHGSLVHRLPVELRNYIFELLLPPRTKWGGFLPSNGLARPTYLASVCRSWRDIAWSNPSLWSTISVVTKGVSTADQSDKFVRDWIRRSGTLPLTLRIIAHVQEEKFRGVIDAISQCSNRWHSLSLCMPLDLLRAFNHLSNLKYPHLKKLQLLDTSRSLTRDGVDQPVPLLNPTASPEEVAMHGVSSQSLHLSWNHLSVAHVRADFGLEDVVQLFQHAPQMTECNIMSVRTSENVSMPPIIHRRLKILGLYSPWNSSARTTLLDSLTLPNLQEFHTNDMFSMTPAHLPALAHRSSCPLTRIKLCGDLLFVTHLQPFPGVIDLVLDTKKGGVVKELLLEDYFPDLRHLILLLPTFLVLWDMGIISMLLDRRRARSDAPYGRRLRKLIVKEREKSHETVIVMWDSDVGKELKAMDIDISMTERGFEIILPNEDD